ncbi:cysteine-rich repeat secretory protein 12-like isoform X1 [Cucumis melo var. makuwa]|uniref:Cysteine-rich repeat secretory protein 12-like isoform X1 n=1 Tax=Cucumis melo var. makuwa TaxID=1194695 RepID=A0A5A7TWT2_CUCMM|nr:cysteine-rich repeat secretory protein 12-like isoform X1 [Cucumis melo var. makuwa]TYK05559.1 cysteine-rich repeat secretory protein 12-like isoform X1 [Cucumis melo var. makuwa]
MSATERRFSFSSFLTFLYGAIVILTPPSSSASLDTFVFVGCTIQKYIPNSPYDSNLNLLLTRLVASAASATYGNFTVLGSASQNTIYGLYQCRGDLNSGDCSQCVAGAVSRLGTICSDACGGALQLEGCFVKYDNKSFFGVEDKTVVVKKCGASIGSDVDALTGVDAALEYLVSSGGTYKTGGSGDVRSVAQCVGDLSASECQDCVSDAIGRLKSACGPYSWGDLFLAKCYARFTRGADHAQDNGNGFGYANANANGNSKSIF